MESTKSSQPSSETKNPNPSSSPFSPFKSKKILRSTSKPSTTSSNQINPSDPNTPQKPIQPKHQQQQRIRTRSSIFSLNEVKQIAKTLNKSPKPKPSDPLDLLQSSPSSKRSKKKPVNQTPLPEKYEILAKLFDSFVCSVRLLRMKGTICSFNNISKKMESLTDRRFSYNQLAQMKYILPEGIGLKKDLMCDELTLCMRPYLRVTLDIDSIENDGRWKGGIGYSNLGKVFRARLFDFIKEHPEGDEIPEEALPEPFNQTKEKVVMKENQATLLPVRSSAVAEPHHPKQHVAAATHLSRSFQKRFVQRFPISESEKTQLLSATERPSLKVEPHRDSQVADCNDGTTCSVVPSLSKHSSLPALIEKPVLFSASTVGLPPPSRLKIGNEVMKSMKQNEYSPKKIDPNEGTPAKVISTPAKLMAMTPDLQTPKRYHGTQDDDSISSPSKLVRRPPRNRPLFQTPTKNAKSQDESNEMGTSSFNDDLLKLLPESLVQSLREKDKRTAEGHDIAISEAKRRRQMIASLPKLFNMIHLMFNSDKRKVITKPELTHRIMASHFDIVDRGEFEQQLKLLLDLAPDWISEKIASSGDHLLCVNVMSCPDTIRKRLMEAV